MASTRIPGFIDWVNVDLTKACTAKMPNLQRTAERTAENWQCKLQELA